MIDWVATDAMEPIGHHHLQSIYIFNISILVKLFWKLNEAKVWYDAQFFTTMIS